MVQISSSNASCNPRHVPAHPSNAQATGRCPFADTFVPATPQPNTETTVAPAEQTSTSMLQTLRGAWDTIAYHCGRTKKELVQWTRLLANSVVSITEIALGTILRASQNRDKAAEKTT